MPCNIVKNGIVCSRGAVETCDFPSCNERTKYLCDEEIGSEKTCDKHMCAQHAHEMRPNYHKCWLHMGAF